MLNGQQVCCVLEARNSGLLMDSDLRFEKHIHELVRNCFCRLKVTIHLKEYIPHLLRFIDFLPSRTSALGYQALVQPISTVGGSRILKLL
ncbi:hypothetical protein EVAR_101933_1 [Eumeta japonica]|uniref:Uncharacterized protein n=1 Tax=Eumeta variegata TaxID=151549 RepID=A0A4C1TSE8_EUMVA|nr:hypothetical protein EVAR_101933_1 [Eumeta japonica]